VWCYTGRRLTLVILQERKLIEWTLKSSGMSVAHLRGGRLTLRMALAQFGTRFKIGYHHAQLIEYFLDRATNPTFEKLAAHYPEHPRPGAPELGPNSDLGKCIINALNIKRGYWKLPRSATSNPAQAAGISPFDSNESTASGSGSGSGSGSSNQYTNHVQGNFMGRWGSEDNSPSGANNPFIQHVNSQGLATSGFAASTALNPYLTAIGGDFNGDGMKEMAENIGSGDGFGTGPKKYWGVYPWSISDGVDPQTEAARVPGIPERDELSGGVKPLCYRQG
jgi:hypothetical protein